MFSSDNVNVDINPNPCDRIASDSDMTLSDLGLGPYLPWLQMAGLASHSWAHLSTLESPVPSLFRVLKLLHFSFSPV